MNQAPFMFYDILANKALILATLADIGTPMSYFNITIETYLNFLSVLPVISFTNLKDPSVLSLIDSSLKLRSPSTQR